MKLLPAVFEEREIRRVYDEKTETWFFSVVDIVQVLTQQPDYQAARKYWNKLKERLRKEGSESVTNCHRLKLPAADGKSYLTDVATAETLLRLVQSVPSPRAEPIKLWLAKVGYERMQEMSDPSRALDRAGGSNSLMPYKTQDTSVPNELRKSSVCPSLNSKDIMTPSICLDTHFICLKERRACDHYLSMSVRVRFTKTLRYACLFVVATVAVVELFLWIPVRGWFSEYAYAQRVGIRDVIRAADHLTYRRSVSRLAGGFAYRRIEPAVVLRGAVGPTQDPSTRRVYSAVAGSSFGSRDPRSSPQLHAVGVAQLVAGNDKDALTTLEMATMVEARQSSIATAIGDVEDAALLSDLAAASYAVGQRDGRSELILRTIDLTSRALTIEPGLAAAAFNRALAIESILTRAQAGEAWNDYLKLDAGSGWADEAREHIQKLANYAGSAKQARSTEVSATSIEEKLLPAWGDAFLRGDARDASAALDEAALTAEALRACCSDEFHARAVEIVRRALEGDRTLAMSLAIAHQQYGRGRSLYAQNQTSTAIPLFTAARNAFRHADDVFALKPWKYLAASHLYLGDAKRALREIDDAVEFCSGPACTPAALAHLRWAQAMASGRAGDPQLALECYAKALQGFESGKEYENAASVHALIAENLEFLGVGEEAWPHRRIALRSAEGNGTLDRIFIAFNEAADAAFRRGHVAAARLFQDVVVAAARRESNTLMLANALFWRGRLSHAAGDDAALRDFEEADALALRVADRDRRLQLTAGIAAARAEAVQPREAIESLTTAIHYFETAPNHYRLAELYAARAEAEEKESLPDLTEADFVRCIRELESERSGIAETALRQRYFSQGSEVFDRAIRHLWRVNRRADAFALAEQSRGREITGGVVPAQMTQRDLPGALRDGDVLLEYALLDDRMLIWIVRSSGTTALETPTNTSTVAAAVAALNDSYERDIEIDQALRGLTALIFDPIAAKVRDARRLIVVANKSLRAVPFGALRDGITNHYLIQDHEIVIAPSASTYVQSLRRDRAMPRSGEPSVMLASYTSADPGRHLQPLYAGRNEIRKIGALYRAAAIITEQDATPLRVLASAATATVVHIVAHEIENHAHPEFSSIALAPSRDGRDLYANAIAATSFRSTRLVFLSACGTSGANAYNDPQLTVPESFLVGGVPLVVGALRPVDDAAAAALAIAFHRAFAATGDPVASLRRAQLDCLASAACRNPKDWSPWIAIGGAT